MAREWRREAEAVDRLTALAQAIDRSRPFILERAPGRLDVMGGIADYSGSVVLQMPLDRYTSVALQPASDRQFEAISLQDDGPLRVRMGLEELLSGPLADPIALGVHLRTAGSAWGAYVLGCVQRCAMLASAERAIAAGGFRLVIHSDVPEGAGLSSSAALEVAVMRAVARHFGVEMDGETLAAHCQRVEHEVVGAPCGIMDQLTCAIGQQGHLLRIRCQPAVVEGFLPIPDGISFLGIDSGARHSVAGAAYTTARAAAFMGYRILADAVGLRVRHEDGRVHVQDDRWHGYLANVSPAEFAGLEEHLPPTITGAEFLDRWHGHTDTVTTIDPQRSYPVRAATRHPVLERPRAERFAALLEGFHASPENAVEMGQLMFASHASYSACGLGSPETDSIVNGIRTHGRERGLLGARITGGGSGGTVAVLRIDSRAGEPRNR